MEFVAVLNLLWARRIVVGLGLLAAIAVGYAMKEGSPAATRSAVDARVLVDTTGAGLASTVEDPHAVADSLPMRAALLAEVMATDQVRTLLASHAHIRLSQLDVVPPSYSTFVPFGDLISQKSGTLGAYGSGRYVLTLLADEQTPLISIEADAPDQLSASRLADAAIYALKSSLASQQAGEGPPVVVRTVASPQRVELPSHVGRRSVAVIATLGVFALWCGGIVLVSCVARRMRRPLPA
jgi:hypothetical protein